MNPIRYLLLITLTMSFVLPEARAADPAALKVICHFNSNLYSKKYGRKNIENLERDLCLHLLSHLRDPKEYPDFLSWRFDNSLPETIPSLSFEVVENRYADSIEAHLTFSGRDGDTKVWEFVFRQPGDHLKPVVVYKDAAESFAQLFTAEVIGRNLNEVKNYLRKVPISSARWLSKSPPVSVDSGLPWSQSKRLLPYAFKVACKDESGNEVDFASRGLPQPSSSGTLALELKARLSDNKPVRNLLAQIFGLRPFEIYLQDPQASSGLPEVAR